MKKYIIYSLFLSLLVVACSEDVLDVKNENKYVGTTFFTNATSYTEASTAMYTPLIYQGMYAREWYFIFDLLGNDAEKNFPLQGGLLEFPNYTYTPNNSELNPVFNSCYKLIFRTNFVIDQIEKWQTTVPAEMDLKVRITGEAQFLKSLSYFWLVNLFGDVPLKDNIASHYVMLSERTPKEQIWASIEKNLKEAIDKLPVAYANEADYGRVTKGAAQALLGKVYLYQKKYADAATELVKLTAAPYSYGLATSLDDLFIDDKKTNETVFAVMNGPWQGWDVGNAYYMFGGQELWGGKATHTGRAMEYGFNDWWNVLVSNALVDAFTYPNESGASYTDPRAALTFYSANGTKGGDATYCDECADSIKKYGFKVKDGQKSWRKYELYEKQNNYGQPDSPINGQVIRYADVLLMLAESYIEDGKINQALPLINQVRARSGAFQYTSLGDKTNATNLLRRERQIELAGEQHRFFDLVRWGTLVSTINAEKLAANGIAPVKDYHVLLPIPQSERDANPTLNAQVKNNWN
ncbi:MAG TPA: RagB/SusD family nutrient uptake outer membrane protein [Prolixibacteraceae bacterium]